MPKKLLATTIILALTVTLLSSISMANANFSPASGLFIQSPGDLIYSGDNSTSISLWIEAIVSTGASPIIAISYSIDDGANITLSKLEYTTYYPSKSPYNMDVYYNRNEKLDNLTDGTHTVRAYCNEMSYKVDFAVQKNGKTGIFLNGFPDGYPPIKELPTLNVISPQNGDIYSADTVKINFSVTTPASWNLYNLGLPAIGDYTVVIFLEGTNQTSIPYNPLYKNATMNYIQDLSGLAKGEHVFKIDVIARTFYKNTNPEPNGPDYLFKVNNISETVHFTVNSQAPPNQQTEPFPIVTVAAVSSVGIAVVGAGLLVYFRRRRGSHEENSISSNHYHCIPTHSDIWNTFCQIWACESIYA